METLDRVWVDYRCHKCGKAWRAAPSDTVYCPCNNHSQRLTPMTQVGDLQVKAQKGAK